MLKVSPRLQSHPGKGVGACGRSAYAQVSVVDINLVAALEARFDGFAEPVREHAISRADAGITVTDPSSVLNHELVVLYTGDGRVVGR